MFLGRARKVAAETGHSVQRFAQHVFEMAARFIDSTQLLDRAIGRIHPSYHFVENAAQLPDDALVRFGPRIDAEDAFAGRIEDDLTEWNRAKLMVFVQEPGNELIERRVFRRFSGGRSDRQEEEDRQWSKGVTPHRTIEVRPASQRKSKPVLPLLPAQGNIGQKQDRELSPEESVMIGKTLYVRPAWLVNQTERRN